MSKWGSCFATGGVRSPIKFIIFYLGIMYLNWRYALILDYDDDDDDVSITVFQREKICGFALVGEFKQRAKSL